MARTLRQTATALSRGCVGRKPKPTPPRSEVHELHRRHFQMGEEARFSKAQSHPESEDVYAAG
ncbi:MAG: hypothetical protein JXR76_31940, partial [Deltaproteobacteria bacterium]|nr:hypothetical protein [Deltaproteobacteria bacterium]